jgi:hypothetical protein
MQALSAIQMYLRTHLLWHITAGGNWPGFWVPTGS